MEWIVYAYAISGKTIHDFYEVSESHPPTKTTFAIICLIHQDCDTTQLLRMRVHDHTLTHVSSRMTHPLKYNLRPY